MQVPCGRCNGCRIQKTKEWAARCYHEASLYDDNCFITLTYSDDHLPTHGTLIKHHFRDFMKRLRKNVQPKKIRYYQCGEYGEKLGRPHYHALIFNHDFVDKELFQRHNETNLYISKTLTKIWGKGHASVGTVTLESAGYVARYAMKKLNGEKKLHHYMRLNETTGELHELEPEYANMSLKPGIGADWFKQYKDDVFPDDFLVINGKKVGTPNYYMKLLERADPQAYEDIKAVRLKSLAAHKENNTPERLAVREICLNAKLNLKERRLK